MLRLPLLARQLPPRIRQWNSMASSRSSLRTSASTHQDEVRSMAITRIYADGEEQSRFGSFLIRMTGSGDIGYLSMLKEVTGIQFRYTPASYNYSWHNAPNRQFIINLDADVEVEVSSGEKKVIKQGEVFFVEDTKGKGHYSRSVSSQPRHSVFILVDDSFEAVDQ